MKKPLLILLVEDNPHNLFLFSNALRELGHQVVEADSGEKALLLGSSVGPDLVLLDIGLPGMSGYFVADELRAHPELADCPIIAVTAHRLEPRDLAQQGIDHVIQKPVSPRELAAEVEAWWEMRAARE
jgi:two-component system, LuxR family, sensor kinase FixL